MPDSRIKISIADAVRQSGQSPDLSAKIVAWLEQIAIGNERVDDRVAAKQHLERIFDAIDLGGEDTGNAE